MSEDLELAERQTAVRALLAQPVLTVDHPRFPLVRRHTEWLRDTFASETGWRLTVDGEVARLHKHPPAADDASRPATDRKGQPLSRRRYVLLCVSLAVIERAEIQLTLSWLVEQLLAETAGTDIAVSFDLRTPEQRRDLIAVVRLLVDLGVISRVAGDEQAFIDQSGDALYDVNRRVLGRMLAADRGPSRVAATEFEQRLAGLAARPTVDSPEAKAAAARRDLGRRLLDNPITYLDDLEDRETEYLRTQRGAVIRRLTAMAGFEAEVRAEGIALLDPTGEATDVGLPEDGTEGHVTLLVAEFLAQFDAGSGATPVAVDSVRTHVVQLIARFGQKWRKSAREEGAERALTKIALERLAQLGLVDLAGGQVLVRPAISRFAADEPTIAGQS